MLYSLLPSNPNTMEFLSYFVPIHFLLWDVYMFVSKAECFFSLSIGGRNKSFICNKSAFGSHFYLLGPISIWPWWWIDIILSIYHWHWIWIKGSLKKRGFRPGQFDLFAAILSHYRYTCFWKTIKQTSYIVQHFLIVLNQLNIKIFNCWKRQPTGYVFSLIGCIEYIDSLYMSHVISNTTFNQSTRNTKAFGKLSPHASFYQTFITVFNSTDMNDE